jgi:hypothetical protein
MPKSNNKSSFKAELLRPSNPGRGSSWTFLLVPRQVSKALPRRGRTSVGGTINGHPFQATLEPDGQLSHWLKVDRKLQQAAGISVGQSVSVELGSLPDELEPELPGDVAKALKASPAASEIWDSTTTIARIDWIHWITSAKQATTRDKRIRDACEMLADGKKRVCCFDPSGYYSKALRAPEAAE